MKTRVFGEQNDTVVIEVRSRCKAEAKWKHRAEHNDFIWCECSNCGFRVEAYKAVVSEGRDTNYVAVKYNYCPICGKSMGV